MYDDLDPGPAPDARGALEYRQAGQSVVRG
jgi:hypothetical protein